MRDLTGPPHQQSTAYHSLNTDEPESPSSFRDNPFASDTHTLNSHDSSSDIQSIGSDQYIYSRSNSVNNDSSRGYNNNGSNQYLPHHRPPVPPSRHSKPFIDYPASTGGVAMSTVAATTNSGTLLLPPSSRPSSASLDAMNSAEYDRYPNRISSAAPSIASASPLLRHGAAGPGAHGGNQNRRPSSVLDGSGSSVSSTDRDSQSNNPFVVNADFSPFGGYPASSFPLHLEEKEADDYLHNPDPILDAKFDRRCQRLDRRGWASVIAFSFLLVGALCLFVLLPVLTYTGLSSPHAPVQVLTVPVLTEYEYGILSAIRTTLVDPDTPESAQSHTARDGSSWTLVFSDEFNKEGRTFYDGDDQFWTAPDIHYAATTDLEWYDPDATSTENGSLVLTLDAFKNHDLFYRSGMLQSWNKLCFTQGMIEVSASLPGKGKTPGLWPGIWTMGNLGRPGYLSTTEGVWPYGYSSCDAGITANQSSFDGISYLPGQKLNSCTCPGEDHPNPGVGRGAPEIDALEGTVDSTLHNGVASQSLQTAPFDIWYMPDYNFIEIHNRSVTSMNTYCGGPFQQAISGITMLNHDWYEFPSTAGDDTTYQKFGFEYLNDVKTGYIRWFVGDEPTYTLYPQAIGPNGNVGQREISKEPMSIVLNLGISNSWTYIDWPALVWPSHMRIDYVRVYQPSNAVDVTCDPASYPTFDYIQDHANAYNDANLTSWRMAGYTYPANKLTGC